jgi:hypothetical protein
MKWNKVILATLLVTTAMSSNIHGMAASTVLRSATPFFNQFRASIVALLTGAGVTAGAVIADAPQKVIEAAKEGADALKGKIIPAAPDKIPGEFKEWAIDGGNLLIKAGDKYVYAPFIDCIQNSPGKSLAAIVAVSYFADLVFEKADREKRLGWTAWVITGPLRALRIPTIALRSLTKNF